jgi:hypothetical protein
MNILEMQYFRKASIGIDPRCITRKKRIGRSSEAYHLTVPTLLSVLIDNIIIYFDIIS